MAGASEVAEARGHSEHITRVLRDTRQLFETSNSADRDDQGEIQQHLSFTGDVRSLSDAQLASLLLRREQSGSSVLKMAHQVTAELSDLASVRHAGDVVLRQLGPGNAATVLAAVELGRRLARADMISRNVLDQPEAVAAYLTFRYARPDQEIMGALYFDGRQHLLAERELFRGTLSRAAVEPRAILKEALLHGAASFVLFHSHPSGDPAPSDEDLSFTRRMAEAGALIGVRLLDHLIVGGGRWVSLPQHEPIETPS